MFDFDYELHTPVDDGGGGDDVGGNDGLLREAIDEFQNGLAGSMAADFGVYCLHDNNYEDVRRRRLGKEFSVVMNNNETDDDAIGGGGMYAPVCLGVSSSPSDVPDDFISEF